MGYQGKKTKEMVAQYNKELDIINRPSKWFWVPANVDVNEYLKSEGIDTSGGFKVLPKRWIVERTFAWLGKYRRLSKDYEYLARTSEVMIVGAMIRTMLNRWTKLTE